MVWISEASFSRSSSLVRRFSSSDRPPREESRDKRGRSAALEGVLEGGWDSVGVDGVGSTYGFVSTFRYEVAMVVVGVVAGLRVATEEFNPSSVFGGTPGVSQSSGFFSWYCPSCCATAPTGARVAVVGGCGRSSREIKSSEGLGAGTAGLGWAMLSLCDEAGGFGSIELFTSPEAACDSCFWGSGLLELQLVLGASELKGGDMHEALLSGDVSKGEGGQWG